MCKNIEIHKRGSQMCQNVETFKYLHTYIHSRMTVKTIHLRLTEQDHELLKMAKGKLTWEEWVISTARQQVQDSYKEQMDWEKVNQGYVKK